MSNICTQLATGSRGTYAMYHLVIADVRYIEDIFVVKLSAQKIDSHFKNTQLPLNEDDGNIEEQLSYINFKKTVRKFHDTDWKNSYHTSADVSILGYGCGMSQYTKLFVEDLDMYQMLPRPYLRYFDGDPGDKLKN